MMRVLFIALMMGNTSVDAVSPVQKVVQLLEECKLKVQNDLAAEGKSMEEYTTFCDDGLKEKGYAIQTSSRTIADLQAAIENNQAIIAAMGDKVQTLGSKIAGKEQEMFTATSSRKTSNDAFVAAENELVKSVDETSRAVAALSRGMALAQTDKHAAAKELAGVRGALESIVAAVSIETQSTRKLKSFLQSTAGASDDLSLAQPQAKSVAYESKSGGILQTVKDMQTKAEGELSDLRRKEAGDNHNFKVLEQSLNNEISHKHDTLTAAQGTKNQASQDLAGAQGDLVETQRTQAADQQYSATLKQECDMAADEWASRQQSAKEETGAIDKAKELLVGGVTAFSQVGMKTRHLLDEDDEKESLRSKLAAKFHSLGKKFHSFGLMQMANSAASDPFVKIRGLIEDMLSKLISEANEEATMKAFCDEEQGKSTNSQAEKTAQSEKLQTRIDQAATAIAELTGAVKTLDSEMAAIDAEQSEATAVRATEHVDNTKAMKDFKDSANAVIAAIGVLRAYYEGAALLQTSSKTGRPQFGGARSDTGGSIISVLEVAESDFTRLFAETETEEDTAASGYKKLSEENRVSKAAKRADAKAKKSEIRSLQVNLEHHKEDHDSVSDELDAVNAYLDKLRPQCESKAMSYEERKAAREAEISGLKEALEILEGRLALIQQHSFLSVRHTE